MVEVNAELQINLQMIVDSIDDTFDVLRVFQAPGPQHYRNAYVYYGQEDLDTSFLYVAEAAVFDQYPIANPNICKLSVGALAMPEEEKVSLIEISSSARWQDVLNAVQAAFARIYAWSQKLQHILASGGGPHELCVAAMEYFKNPLHVHDDQFNVMAMPTWVVGMSKIVVDKVTGNRSFTLSKIQGFAHNPAYIHSLTTHGAQLWDRPENNARCLYVNLWLQDKYYGRFLIVELSSSFKPSHFYLAEYFCQFLLATIERNRFKVKSATSFEAILHQIYLGQSPEPQYLQTRLQMVGWENSHRFLCIAIHLDALVRSTLTANKLSSTMSLLFPNSFSFSYEGQVFTICNLTLAQQRPPAIQAKLEELCDTLEAEVGISNAFTSLSRLREYYRQAEKAIDLGRQYTPEKKVYPFRDYAMNYILRHFTEEFSIQAVCSDAILRLAQSDQERGTDYIRTLQCYFNNDCQQTATAQAMYIHRSTLNYRLERIQSIAGVDFSDPDTKLFLQISMKLLKEELSHLSDSE